MKMGQAGDGVIRSADASLRMATIYILMICFIALLTLLPMFLLTMFFRKILSWIVLFFRLLHDGNSVLNIVIYGAMNRLYREVSRTVILCRSPAVGPSDLSKPTIKISTRV